MKMARQGRSVQNTSVPHKGVVGSDDRRDGRLDTVPSAAGHRSRQNITVGATWSRLVLEERKQKGGMRYLLR